MSRAEIRTWRAEYEIEPWGELRSDQRAAATIANARALKGVKSSWQEIGSMVNPWRELQEAEPSRELLRKKIAAFNAGLKAAGTR